MHLTELEDARLKTNRLLHTSWKFEYCAIVDDKFNTVKPAVVGMSFIRLCLEPDQNLQVMYVFKQ